MSKVATTIAVPLPLLQVILARIITATISILHILLLLLQLPLVSLLLLPLVQLLLLLVRLIL